MIQLSQQSSSKFSRQSMATTVTNGRYIQNASMERFRKSIDGSHHQPYGNIKKDKSLSPASFNNRSSPVKITPSESKVINTPQNRNEIKRNNMSRNIVLREAHEEYLGADSNQLTAIVERKKSSRLVSKSSRSSDMLKTVTGYQRRRVI